MEPRKFEQWALVEIFGHAQIVGLVSEQVLGGCSFVRVDVPAVDDSPAFTKLYGQGAIYAMTFLDEQTARAAVRNRQQRPIEVWTARQLLADEKIRLRDPEVSRMEGSDVPEDWPV